MLTRDSYIALLEKRASAESSIPPNDSAEATTQEHNNNKEDNRQYLHSIFPNAAEVQSNQSATIKKLFSETSGKTITSNPLLKLGSAVFKTISREPFINAINETSFFKNASPLYIELAYGAFCNELEKIGTDV